MSRIAHAGRANECVQRASIIGRRQRPIICDAAAAVGGPAGCSCEVGTLTSPASTGVQNYNHSLGVAPKAIIIVATPQTAAGSAANAILSMGFATSSTNRGTVSNYYADGGGFTEDRRHSATRAIQTITASGAVVEQADFDSFSTTQFSLDWETINASAYRYHYMLLAGDDLEANVVSFVANTSTGNQNVAHGLGGAPTGVLALSAHNLGSPDTADGAAEIGMTVGASDITTDRVSSTWGASGSGGTRYQIDKFLAHAQAVTPVEEANLDSVDGTNVVIDWDAASAAEYYYLLCLRGCTMKVGTFLSPTSADTVNVATGLSSIAGALVFGCMAPDSASNEDEARLSIGVADGSSDACAGHLVDLSENADMVNSNTKSVLVYNHTPALQESADINFSGGTMNVVFDAAVATQNEFHYLAIQ